MALSLALAAFATTALAQGQVFHNGDHVLVTPYGGAWAECTLTSDRLGYANNYSYMAVCAPMMKGSSPDPRPHQYSEERVKSPNDPVAMAGITQQRAIWGGPYGAPAAPQQQTYQPQYPAAAPQQAYQPQYPAAAPQQAYQPQYPQPQQTYQAPPQDPQQASTQQGNQAPNAGPPGLGPPPPMDAPARPGYGPAQ